MAEAACERWGIALLTGRLAILPDFPEEAWPSMDLVAEMLCRELHAGPGRPIQADRLIPPFHRRMGGLPGLGRRRWAFNADRLLNRLWDYPRFLRQRAGDFDLFHVCDHAYSQLVHVLPAGRAGVYCHDLDTFRCLLDPARERRPRWFRAMMRHVLRGLQKAAVVFHSTGEVRRQIERHGLLDPARLVHAPYGVAPEFSPEARPGLVPPEAALDGGPFLLHVGSCIPRKRVDVLLDVFASLRRRHPDLRLVQAGGQFSPAQQRQIEKLALGPAVVQLRGLDRPALAALYCRSALVLLPSEAEGFGLPMIEALACGAVVVASDLPVLREVGGDAVVYCPVAEVAGWADSVDRLLADPGRAPSRAVRLAWAQRYSWAEHARIILQSYLRLLDR